MNTYLIPISSPDGPSIESVKAKDLSSAMIRFMKSNLDADDPVPADWEDFLNIMEEIYQTTVGDIYDISEF